MSAKNIVFIAAQDGVEPNTGRALQSIESQTRQALENIVSVLEPAKLGKDSIARCTLYVVNPSDFAVADEVYHAFFGNTNVPARTLVGVAALPKSNDSEILISIEAVAIER